MTNKDKILHPIRLWYLKETVHILAISEMLCTCSTLAGLPSISWFQFFPLKETLFHSLRTAPRSSMIPESATTTWNMLDTHDLVWSGSSFINASLIRLCSKESLTNPEHLAKRSVAPISDSLLGHVGVMGVHCYGILLDLPTACIQRIAIDYASTKGSRYDSILTLLSWETQGKWYWSFQSNVWDLFRLWM